MSFLGTSLDLEKKPGQDGATSTDEAQEQTSSSASKESCIGGWRAASLILGMELCERLAFLGVGLNLVTYLHDEMHLPIPMSANIVTNFMGTSYVTALIGGFIADTYLGRYGTTIAGCVIELMGMVLIMLTTLVKGLKPAACEMGLVEDWGGQALSCKQATNKQMAVLYMALYMIACGAGGTKSSVSGLGADQFKEEETEGRRQMQCYFNWFGASVSGGGVLAVTTLVYLQDHAGRAVGYAASLAFMLLCLLFLLAASPLLRSKPPSGSAFTCIAHVFVAAWRNRHLPTPTCITSSTSPQLSFLNKATLPPYFSNKIQNSESPWRSCSTEKVEDVKMMIRVLPIFATTIVFWTVNGQALTFSIEQGATLKRRIGKSFDIPPASVPIFLQLGMLVTIPFYDRVLIPFAKKWRGNDYGITNLQRIGIGLLVSSSSMVVAAMVEKKRLKIAHSSGVLARRSDEALPMSVFFLAPQYALVGIGQAFAYVGQIDFFYRASPLAMRSLSTGLCLSTLSFGLFLSSALVSSVNRWTKHGSGSGWLTNNLNDGRLDYFYWFLAVLSFLSFVAYLVCAHWYKFTQRNANIFGNKCNQKFVQNLEAAT